MDLWQMSARRAWFGMFHHMYTCMYDKSHLFMCKTVLFLAHTSPPNWFRTGIKKLVRGLTSRGLRQPSAHHQKLVWASWIN